MERWKKRPEKVDRAIAAGDREAIQNMASAGGKASGEKRHIEARNRRDAEAFYDEKAFLEELRRREEANEHIVPIESEEEDDN